MPEETCPGSTETCRQACFGKQGRFLFAQVQERLRWNWLQACRTDFVERMTREIRKKGVLVLRVHPVGDFATPEYAEKWLAVMRKSPRTRFFAYTRSHARPDILPFLGQMAALRCMRLWFSVDRDCPMPVTIPPGVRLAFLQVEDGEPVNADLTFRVRRLRRTKRTGLPMVCPSETPAGKANDVNCGNCGHCWR